MAPFSAWRGHDQKDDLSSLAKNKERGGKVALLFNFFFSIRQRGVSPPLHSNQEEIGGTWEKEERAPYLAWIYHGMG